MKVLKVSLVIAVMISLTLKLYCCFFEKKSPPSPYPRAFNIFFSVFSTFTMMSPGVIFCIYPVWGFLSFLNLWLDFFQQFWKTPSQRFRYYLPSSSPLLPGFQSLPGLSVPCSHGPNTLSGRLPFL